MANLATAGWRAALEAAMQAHANSNAYSKASSFLQMVNPMAFLEHPPYRGPASTFCLYFQNFLRLFVVDKL